MPALNKVMLIGHLTRDPEVKTTSNGIFVCPFSIGVQRPHGKDKSKDAGVDFVECEAWGKTAETIGKYLTKGSSIYVEGRLKIDSWQDSNGTKKKKAVIAVESFQFLEKKERVQTYKGGDQPQSQPKDNHRYTPADCLPPMPDLPPDSEEIPF